MVQNRMAPLGRGAGRDRGRSHLQPDLSVLSLVPREIAAILEDILQELKAIKRVQRRETLSKGVYTTGEASQLLKISPYTVLRLIKGGKIQATRIGEGQRAQYRIPAEALEKLLDERR